MDKVKELLERHVQWIAVAVGGLIFMWALWTYVLSPDPVVSTEVAGETVGPGEVDDLILSRLARDLEGKIDGAPAAVPQPPNLTREILASIELGEPAGQIAAGPLPASPYPLKFDEVEAGDDDVGLDELPTPPPAIILAVEAGRGEYDVPSPLPEDAEIDFSPDAPLPPERPTTPEDLTYAVVRYAIPSQALRQRFADTALPATYQVTNVLDVTLLRERRLPDGTWGERAEVPRLRNYLAPPVPPTSASLTDKKAYMDWARANAGQIVQPPFYALIAGDDPRYLAVPDDSEATGGDNADVAGNPIDPDTGFHAGFDPNDRSTWPPTSELTPEERRAIRDARRNPGGQDGPGGDSPFNPYGPGGGGGGGNPYGGYGGSSDRGAGGNDANGGTVNVQNRGGARGGQPDGPPDGGYNPYNPYGGGPDGGYNPYNPYGGYGGPEFPGGPEGPGDPGQPGPARDAGAVPGEFNPVQLDSDIEGWAYDESAVPGEVYRYNVVYSLRNPVFATTNVTEDSALEERLAISVEPTQTGWSEQWSRGLRVEPTARWFMKATTVDGRGARFDVFRYQNGRWQSETFKVEPGEMLGGVVDGVDYSTGRVLADVRTDPSSRDRVAVLVDAQGRLSVHDADEDESVDYDELERLTRDDARAAAE